jgi:hypothetical protein
MVFRSDARGVETRGICHAHRDVQRRHEQGRAIAVGKLLRRQDAWRM